MPFALGVKTPRLVPAVLRLLVLIYYLTIKSKDFLYNNSDLCQPVKVEVLNVINCKVWTDIIRPCVSRVDVNPPVFCAVKRSKVVKNGLT